MIFFFFYTQILQQPSFRETVLFIHSLLFSVSHQNDSFAFSSFFHGCLIPLLFSRHSLQDWKAMNKDTSEWMNQMQSMNEMNGERNESESVFEWLSVREKTVERSKRKLQIMWSKDRSQERREVGQKGEAGSVSFFFRPRLLLLHFFMTMTKERPSSSSSSFEVQDLVHFALLKSREKECSKESKVKDSEGDKEKRKKRLLEGRQKTKKIFHSHNTQSFYLKSFFSLSLTM